MTALQPGTRLGPYEVADLLGAGGMGEVYRALDTRLGRNVALKILSADFAREPERRLRFEREARIIAALNHPHICILFDVGQQDGVDYLVLEVLEGETLAARLDRGPLSLDQVLRIGIEIADALHRAHDKGVVHRDLKPGNVMLTRSGTKLLDFGLAKLQPPGAVLAESELSARATDEMPLTGAHAMLGTVPYMSPEQIEGKEADSRTDIFALGAMLYEMATGRRPFSAESRASVMAAILGSEPPPMASVERSSPPGLERVVRACLAKNPDDRIQNAHDLMLELRWIRDGVSSGSAPVAGGSPRWRWERIITSLGLVSVGLAAMSAVAYWRIWRPPPEPLHFSILPPSGYSFSFVASDFGAAPAPPAVSSDGRSLVFGAVDGGGVTHLWIRSLGALEPRELEATENGAWPFWSPDGRFVAFFADGKLKKVAAVGGSSQSLCDAVAPAGGTWSRLHTLVFSDGNSLYQVPEAGGRAMPLTEISRSGSEEKHLWPAFLPDGRKFLFLVTNENRLSRKEKGGIHLGELGSTTTQRLVPDVSNGQAGAGRLFFVKDGMLVAQTFDGVRVTGEPTVLGTSVQSDWDGWRSTFGVSDSGVVCYRRAMVPRAQLTWRGRDGRIIETAGELENFQTLQLSRDGKRAIASVARSMDEADLWVLDLEKGTQSRLTFESAWVTRGTWSPDGQRVVYSSQARGYADLFSRAADGSGEPTLLVQSDDFKFPTDWSVDGRYIAFDRGPLPSEVWLLSVEDRKATRFAAGDRAYAHGRFSPDSHWLSFESDVSGRYEVYVRPVAGAGGPWQISSRGGTGGFWSRDGKEFAYLTLDKPPHVEMVSLTVGAAVQAGPPRTLFVLPPSTRMVTTVDGERFLVGKTIPDGTSQSISVILNGLDQQYP
jgi:serine/threonine protein kinase